MPADDARSGAAADPAAALDLLAGCAEPYLIGVRHHSPALSVVLPDLLAAFRPQVLLVELPAEFAPWLEWLAAPQTRAPVALAGTVGAAGRPAFYPFADFSPELVAIRWAAGSGVPVVPCDLPLADPAWREPAADPPADAGGRLLVDAPAAPGGPRLAEALQASVTGRPDEDMWDRTVEARAPDTDPETIRRAALLVGWALRVDAATGGGVSAIDLRREAWMRRCLAANAGRRVAAVVGSFHAAALVAGPVADAPADPPQAVVTSLVPYNFRLLDARSGYPAGIRDPEWQQAVLAAAGDPHAVQSAVIDVLVRMCGRIRQAGHPAGPAEAREAVRIAVDLARLRGLPAPGRGELVEALQTVLAHGEVLGRGRVIAAAMERILVGDRRGRLAPGTPRSGLGPAVQDLIAELRLPGPGDPARELRLDPLRSDLDRRRETTLHRLDACGVPYAEAGQVAGLGGLDAMTSRWQARWTPETDAMLDVAGIRGVVLAQAAEGALREQRHRAVAEGGPTVREVIEGLHAAAVCGLPQLAAERLTELGTAVPAAGTLGETIAGLALLDRLRLGHIAGVANPAPAPAPTDQAPPRQAPPRQAPPQLAPEELAGVAALLEAAAVRQVDGLAGSDEVADAHALAALAQRADTSGVGLRLAGALDRLTAGGTPLIAAAAGAVQVLLGLAEPATFGLRIASWVDTATTATARRDLRGHLTGVLAVAEPLLHTGGAVLVGLLDRVETLADEEFLARLPALRGGFQVASPAARGRLLEIVHERLGGGQDVGTVDDPELLMLRLLADRAGRAALTDQGLPVPGAATHDATADPDHPAAPPTGTAAQPAGELTPADRWRLLLGRQAEQLTGRSRRYAAALDELYGAGQGEGSAEGTAGAGAGREPAFPGVREWADELAALFGDDVREEVLAMAAESGRAEAALLLDPASARPSVELLRSVLTLAGGLPEATVARLRPLVARVVEELTRQLAFRLRPALAGITTPRPTARPGGPLDLPRTLRANLARSHRDDEGRLVLVPEHPIFKTRSRRSMDWRMILVVDVSGSMEESVIWSALTSSILAGVPALTTHFVAFSTEIMDLTDQVADPLSLLMEVSVGGGTHIAAGLRYARSLVTVPARSLVVVVSDFEEGYPVSDLLSEVRALAESGCTLLGCASLNDKGRPRYSVPIARQVVAAGMPVAALSPLELARWVGEKVHP